MTNDTEILYEILAKNRDVLSILHTFVTFIPLIQKGIVDFDDLKRGFDLDKLYNDSHGLFDEIVDLNHRIKRKYNLKTDMEFIKLQEESVLLP